MKDSKPAGKDIIEMCSKWKTFNNFCEKLHIKQIAHDFYQKWHEADSNLKRQEVGKEYQRQIILALLLPLGVTTGTALAISFMSDYILMTVFFFTIATSIILSK